MRRGIFVLFVVGIISLSCDHGVSDGEQFLIQSHEWKFGDSFVYSWSIAEIDSTGHEIPISSDTLKVQVASRGETVGSHRDMVAFKGFSLTYDRGSAIIWYEIKNGQLLEVAYRLDGGVPIVFPKRKIVNKFESSEFTTLLSFSLPNIIQQQLGESEMKLDSTIVRDEPRVVYQYPLHMGNFWISFRDPFLQTREIVGVENVSTPLGISRCMKIQVRIPAIIPNMEWFDYVDTKGLVSRTVLVKTLRMSAGFINVVDTVRIRERVQLLQRNF